MTLATAAMSQRDDAPAGGSVASVLLQGPPTEHWGGHFCGYVWIRLDVHAGGGWVLDCSLELADAARTQWVVVRRYYDRDEAGIEAGAYYAHAVDLLERSIAGELVVTPGQRRDVAAAAAWCATEECEALTDECEALLESLVASRDGAERAAINARLSSGRTHLESARFRFVQQFHDAHHWSEFTGDAAGRRAALDAFDAAARQARRMVGRWRARCGS